MKTIKIIDAHQHFWDLRYNYYPWLCDDPLIPFRYGDYSAIRRSYLLEDYWRDAERFEVVATIHVEAEWDPVDPVGETRWLQDLADQYGLPSAIVAQAWLDRDDVEDVLAAHAEHAAVRGIRHKPNSAASPDTVRLGAPGSMGDFRWRSGYALLEDHGLSFDLQTPHWHLSEAAELAKDFPRIQMILNHTGLPADRTPAGLSAWRSDMETLAAHPNVAVKISGLGQPGIPWTTEGNRDIVLRTIDIFGIERCMFASNFPVDRLVGSYSTIVGGFQHMVAHFCAKDQRSLFHDNALRFYRLTR